MEKNKKEKQNQNLTTKDTEGKARTRRNTLRIKEGECWRFERLLLLRKFESTRGADQAIFNFGNS